MLSELLFHHSVDGGTLWGSFLIDHLEREGSDIGLLKVS